MPDPQDGGSAATPSFGLPVAAPDPALTEREREWLAAMPTWTDVSGRAIAGKADAFLVERQQDKERIERLETAIGRMMAIPADSRRDMKATGRAALAVEEDAE